MLLRFTEWLRSLLRHGPLHAWWLRRQTKRWERAYCQELLRTSGGPAGAEPVFSASAPLRRILLIADCMWEHNDLVPELQRFAEAAVLDLDPALKSNSGRRPEPEVVTAALEAFGAAHSAAPDVILFYARPNLLSEEVFDGLRRRWTCPLFGMNLDDKLQFFPYGIFRTGGGDDYQRWAGKFDLNLTNCFVATEWYRRRGFPCLYVPQGVHHPPELGLPTSVEYRHELSFLGSRKPERAQLIDQLLAAGVRVKLFGSGWPNSEWVGDANSVYRGTQINLGIGFASPSLTITTLKGRDFECPGVGSCYLTTYNWELTNHFELGKEILCYRSLEELVEIYSWYRGRPEECLKLAQAAWRRSVNEHTWEKRFRRVFRESGFKLSAE